MSSPPASRLGDDASDDESGASSAGPGAYGPPGRKSVGTPLAGKSPNVQKRNKNLQAAGTIIKVTRAEVKVIK